MNTIQQKNRKERPLVLGTGGGTGNLLPVAEGQEGIAKTAHYWMLDAERSALDVHGIPDGGNCGCTVVLRDRPC